MNRDVVETLNGLIKVCIDDGSGYETEASNVNDDVLSALLHELADQHFALATQLQSVVLQLGGEPPAEGAYLGALQRDWLELREALRRQDTEAAVREVERAERRTLDQYETAIIAESMPPAVRSLLTRHHGRIKEALVLVHTFDN